MKHKAKTQTKPDWSTILFALGGAGALTVVLLSAGADGDPDSPRTVELHATSEMPAQTPTSATEPVMPGEVANPTQPLPMPACAREDGSGGPLPCYWDARQSGNGYGSSYVAYRGPEPGVTCFAHVWDQHGIVNCIRNGV